MHLPPDRLVEPNGAKLLFHAVERILDAGESSRRDARVGWFFARLSLWH